MRAYAAFLRGVNLGPSNKVAMPRLREVASGLGWQHVRTHINSGNLLFTAAEKPKTLARELEQALATELGRSIDVAVRSREHLDMVVAGNPYPDREPHLVTVTFVMARLPPAAEQAIRDLATEREPFTIAGSEIYVYYGDGQARSKLAATFASVVKVSTTTRNMRTVSKVLEMLADQPS